MIAALNQKAIAFCWENHTKAIANICSDSNFTLLTPLGWISHQTKRYRR
ncbi:MULTISPECIES: hypothetical protein [unclassified Coleofasciculus]|nr:MULTISPECIES: hypothetical protein [unclassified Coleofasciculus]MBE9127073.1 hypothetical protein [Coleofasciculus sp. LEGE 07081]MBE9150461.1 hypothetical protein [Coleofasciculus sp. LEGE 07092]